jgi:hypothetical protein
MGDKSPKATHKQAAQKEAKKANTNQQKAKGSGNVTPQQAPPPKR